MSCDLLWDAQAVKSTSNLNLGSQTFWFEKSLPIGSTKNNSRGELVEARFAACGLIQLRSTLGGSIRQSYALKLIVICPWPYWSGSLTVSTRSPSIPFRTCTRPLGHRI
jgi:hypothetical protein